MSMRYCAGICLHSKKAHRYLTDALLAVANEKGVEIRVIDRTRHLDEQGPFDIIVHKCNADKDWEYQLEEYSEAHPEVMIVDSIEHIRVLRNRATMLSFIPKLRDGFVTTVGEARVYVPPQMEIQDSVSMEDLETRLQENEMDFPLLVKPKWADGRDGCHMLGFIRNRYGLSHALDPQHNAIEFPFILQQVIPHNSIIFKVYVVGEHVQCTIRASLDTTKCRDSFQLLPRISSRTKPQPISLSAYPPNDLIESLAQLLKNRLSLQLFNFDLIKKEDNTEQVFYVVDINYFPGIDKIDNFEHTFVDFLLNRCRYCKQLHS